MSFAFFRAASSLSCAWITLSILDTSTRMFPWNDGEHVPVKMYCTTLVFCLRKDLCHGIAHSEAFVSHHELYALQTAFFEPNKEDFPAPCVLFHAFCGSDDLTVTVLIHADCHRNADVFKLSTPISLEINPVHINIWIFPGQLAVAPFLNVYVRFLTLFTDGGSRHTATPKGFGDKFLQFALDGFLFGCIMGLDMFS